MVRRGTPTTFSTITPPKQITVAPPATVRTTTPYVPKSIDNSLVTAPPTGMQALQSSGLASALGNGTAPAAGLSAGTSAQGATSGFTGGGAAQASARQAAIDAQRIAEDKTKTAGLAETFLAGADLRPKTLADTGVANNAGTTGLNSLVTSKATDLLNNPSQMDYDKFRTSQMDALALEQARALEKSRQGLADIGNTGAAQQALTAQELEAATAKAQYGGELEAQIAQQKQKDITTALEQGRAAGESATSQWATEQSAQLQKYGIDTDTANKQAQMASDIIQRDADRNLQQYISDMGFTADQAKLAENARQYDNENDFKRWATLTGITADDANRAWQASESAKTRAHETYENSASRQLQRDLQAGTIDLETYKLSQDAQQFTDKLDWDKEATRLGLDAQTADRAWKASESALDRQATAALQQMGISTDALMAFVENQTLTPQQTSDFIRELAKGAGYAITPSASQTDFATDATGTIQRNADGTPVISETSPLRLLSDPARINEIAFGQNFAKSLTESGKLVPVNVSIAVPAKGVDDNKAVQDSINNPSTLFVGPIGEYSSGETRFGAAINGQPLATGATISIGNKPIVVTGMSDAYVKDDIGKNHDGQIRSYTLTDATTGAAVEWNPWTESYDAMVQRLNATAA